MTRHARLAPAAMAALALLSSAGDADAQGTDSTGLIARAKQEMSQLNFESAITLLEQAEGTGQNERAEMIEIYRATAEANAGLGRLEAAEVSFRRALALDPSIELPAGSSPKLTSPFAAARDFVSSRGSLKIDCKKTGEAGGALLTVGSDPVDLVSGARLIGAAGARVGSDASGSGRIALSYAQTATPTGCAALDRFGNELLRADLGEPVAEPTPAAGDDATGGAVSVGADTTVERSRPIYARWWVWGAGAAVSGAAAIYFGLQLKKARDDLDKLNDNSEDHFFEEALDVEERGDRAALNANIALGVTAALGAVSIGLLVHQLLTDGDDREAQPGSARVDPTILPGGGGINVSLGF